MGSYSDTFKAELCGLNVKSACCRKAFLYGLLIRAEYGKSGAVSVLLPHVPTPDGTPAPTALALPLIRKLLGRDAVAEDMTRGAHRYTRVSFVSSQAAAVLAALAETDGNGEAQGDMVAEEAIGFKCADCANHFLRGVFLSSGSVNDPQKSTHLEMRLPPDGRADCTAALWVQAGFEPGVSRSENECRIWFKKREAMEEAMTCLGGGLSVLSLYNNDMILELRINEIRATNWEAANIGRSVDAGRKYIAAIRDLQDWGILQGLSPDLQETAQLRVLHDEMSLSELAARHIPAITKSGLTHRLRKLYACWEKEKEKHP